MYKSETSGLVRYQQAVSQTPGIAPAIWFQSTSPQPPLLVQFIPTKVEKKTEKSFKEKTV